MISKEYEHQHTQRAHCNRSGKSKDSDKDKVLSVIPGRNKGNPCKPHGVCWNCGDKGHYKDKCPKPAVKKDDASKKGSTATANVVIESDSDGKGVFFMEDNDDPDMPDLKICLDSEDDSDHLNDDEDGSDWFTNVEEEDESSWSSEELSGVDWNKSSSFINVDLDLETAEPFEFVAKVDDSNTDTPRTEIYDSGCSKHLTPYCDALQNFMEISPKSL